MRNTWQLLGTVCKTLRAAEATSLRLSAGPEGARVQSPDMGHGLRTWSPADIHEQTLPSLSY